jgi:hypothetical protein
MIREDARIDGEEITAIIKARLKVLLEGYEMHDVSIDDHLAAIIACELEQMLEKMVGRVSVRVPGEQTLPAGTRAQYPQLVRGFVEISPAWIRTEIERRRL